MALARRDQRGRLRAPARTPAALDLPGSRGIDREHGPTPTGTAPAAR